jgi:hypothetical protein
MRPVVVGVIVGWLVLGIWSAPGLADGGSIRLSEEKRGYRITVFSAPSPFRAGPVDMSVLVQDASTGDPMTQVLVTVRMTNSRGLALEHPATSETAPNKLLQAAQFELPEAGRWALEVQVQGSYGLAVIGGELEAAEPLPRWVEIWPWIGWPALVVALFGIRQVCVQRTSRSPTRRGEDDRHELHSRGLEEVTASGDRRPECPLRTSRRVPGAPE